VTRNADLLVASWLAIVVALAAAGVRL